MITILAALAMATTAPSMKVRWFYVQTNLATDANIQKLLPVMEQAKSLGYNGMVLADAKFGRLAQMKPAYFANVEKVKKKAADLDLPITPVVANVGNASQLISGNMNLAEGQPVIKAPYIVKDGALVPVSQVSFRNGSFEDSNSNKLADFTSQDAAGVSSMIDTSVAHSGRASLRLEDFRDKNPSGNVRVTQVLDVHPWQQYRVQLWIKSEGLDKNAGVRCFAATSSGKRLCFMDLEVAKTQDWKQHTIIFNSQDNDRVTLFAGMFGGNKGKVWIDDIDVKEAQFLNVLRRPGTPVTVETKDGKAFTEGEDFERVEDPSVNRTDVSGVFNFDHDFPVIKVKGNKLKEGDKVLVSYTHAVVTETSKVTICPSEPASAEVLLDQFKRVVDLFKPSGLYLAHDEIRVADTCPLCLSRHLSPGELYAEDLRNCYKLAQKALPGGTVYVWSDMFDPNHNAHEDYYLSNGDWKDSWKGIDPKMVVVNWNFQKREKSIPFFDGLGVHQILGGYYDRPVGEISDWLDAAKSTPNVDGVMYATWIFDYSQIEPFAKLAFTKD